jgi:hypothetical protein
MSTNFYRLILIAVVAISVSACGSTESDDSTGPVVDASPTPEPDAGLTADASAPDTDMDMPTMNSDDLDEGEPQPYEYPASLNDSTEPDYTIENCSGNKLSRVRGWVVDRIGRPVTGVNAQLCVTNVSGTLVCLRPARSNTDGTYTLNVPQTESCATKAVLRVIKTGEPRATMYCGLDLSLASDTGEIILREPSVTYATIAADNKPAYAPVEMSRDVGFPSGIVMTVVPDDLFGVEPESDYATLSTRHVLPDERGLCFLGESTQPDHLFTFAPELAVLGDGAAISFENRYDYSAGQPLELWLLGGLDCTVDGEHIEEGLWTQVGTAEVNAAGDRIETDFKLFCLIWIGLRASN